MSRSTVFLTCALVAASIWLTGCAGQRRDMQNSLAELEAENAMQRDRIWKSNMKMEDFRRENEALRRQVAQLEAQTGKSAGSSGGYTPNTQNPVTTPTSVVGTSSTPTLEPSAAQNAVPGNPPAVQLGAPSNASPDWLQSAEPNPPAGTMVQAPQRLVVRKTDSSAVYSVEILRQSVKPINYQGLHVEVQMKDAQGNIVLAAAPLAVVVTDPMLPEKESRISRWDYTAEEIAEIINAGQAGISVPLNMGWENGQYPGKNQLEIHLLYQTSDKRMLSCRLPVDLTATAFQNAPQAQAAASQPQVGANAADVAAERPAWSPAP